MNKRILCILGIMFLTLQACAIRVPQAEAMLNQFQKLVGSEEETRTGGLACLFQWARCRVESLCR